MISAMDLSYGAIYCFVCRDYVYDEEVEKATIENTLNAAQSLGWCFSIFLTEREKQPCPSEKDSKDSNIIEMKLTNIFVACYRYKE